MTPLQYREAIAELGLTQEAAGEWLGVSGRTGQTYASKGPPEAVAMLLDQALYLRRRRKELVDMIDAIDKRGLTIGSAGKDETPSWRATLEGWLAEIDELSRDLPPGLASAP